MPDCPNEHEIACLVEGTLTPAAALEVRRHAASCPECAGLIRELMTLQALDESKLLPVPTAEQTEKMTSALRVSMKAHPAAAETQPSKSAEPVTNRLKKMLGAFAAGAAGAAGFLAEKGLGRDGPMPAFAGKRENHPDEVVRNDGHGDSARDEGTEEAHHPNHEEPSMNQNHAPSQYETNHPGSGDIHDAPTSFGLPAVEGGTSDAVAQHYSDTCAIRSQELILRDFGQQVSEDQLRQEAAAHQWYAPGSGTTPDHVGDLLELHGVHVNRFQDGNIFTLTSELAQGHKVIIGVNSGSLWDPGLGHDIGHALGLNGADHALIVSGIDTTNINDVRVVLTDPGTGDIAKSYPMAQFVDAWKDSHCFMVSTAEPAPSSLPEMANFNYDLGHLDTVAGMSYDDFTKVVEVAQHGDGLESRICQLALHTITSGDQTALPTIHELIDQHQHDSQGEGNNGFGHNGFGDHPADDSLTDDSLGHHHHDGDGGDDDSDA